MELEKQYGFQNRKANVDLGKNQVPTQKKKEQAAKHVHKEVSPKKVFDQALKEMKKVQSGFNLESEIEKIKISVPFNELLKNIKYIKHIRNML